MLRRLLAMCAALLVVVATAAAAGVRLHGTFQTVIAKAPNAQLVGIWQIALQTNGRYTIERNGAVVIRGRGTQTATTITFGHETGPAACTGAQATATYHWSLHAGEAVLKTAHDACAGRRLVLTTHPLLKTG
ncbi:MAG TPA: hypothetical protein VFB25_01690 [Gaiellaceae bacterium]|nr:hypothetical protein [Gaiellaceae bacterium]